MHLIGEFHFILIVNFRNLPSKRILPLKLCFLEQYILMYPIEVNIAPTKIFVLYMSFLLYNHYILNAISILRIH